MIIYVKGGQLLVACHCTTFIVNPFAVLFTWQTNFSLATLQDYYYYDSRSLELWKDIQCNDNMETTYLRA